MGSDKKKRKRGGQKGNQNARKHGFYGSVLSPDEICEFWNIINRENLDPEIAIFRIRLRSLLQHDPGNRRAINDAARLLSRWYGMKYHLQIESIRLLKKTILTIFDLPTAQALYPPGEPDAENKRFLQNESTPVIERKISGDHDGNQGI